MPAAVWSVCGAVIGFEVARDIRASLFEALSYAEVAETTATPTMWYRSLGDQDEPQFIRDDPVRSSTVEPIGTTTDELLDDLHLSVALHATGHVFVHAGVVGWNDQAILVPGRSHSGKSTLVQALVKAGASYLSDEYARIRPDGAIDPYARPIHLRTPSGRQCVDAATIGTVHTTTPLPPGLVVFTKYRTGADFEPTTVSPASAALALFDNTVIAEVQPAMATKAAAHVARAAVAVRSDRSDASTTAEHILQLATSGGPNDHS